MIARTERSWRCETPQGQLVERFSTYRDWIGAYYEAAVARRHLIFIEESSYETGVTP